MNNATLDPMTNLNQALGLSGTGFLGILLVTAIIIVVMMLLVDITAKTSKIRSFFQRTFRRRK